VLGINAKYRKFLQKWYFFKRYHFSFLNIIEFLLYNIYRGKAKWITPTEIFETKEDALNHVK